MKLIEETERFMEEVYSDPEIANAPVPEGMRENVFRQIRAFEEEKAKQAAQESPKVHILTDEDRELIRLGKKYKKQRKARKYLILAAALVLAMAFGVTSLGGPEKVFETFKLYTMGRTQSQVNSDEGVEVVEEVSEEELYQKLEEKYGVQPVKINYLPEGVEFLEGDVYEDMQGIHAIYGKEGKVKAVYTISPNYKISSWGKDIEDELLEEYELQVEETTVYLKHYKVGKKEERGLVGFEYNDVSYSLLIMDTNREEVETIVKKLYFP